MKIILIYGTRPEFLKLYPVINQLKKISSIELIVVNSGQHKEMVLELESFFNYTADIYWNIMSANQSLNSIISKVISHCDHLFSNENPDYVIVQGDTTTVLSASIAAFNCNVKVCHVEAGLRSNNLKSPFPEEFNRRITSIIADLNFAPTDISKNNLLKEGVEQSKIYITGNTIIDTLRLVKNNLPLKVEDEKINILVTAHRRENHNGGINKICNAIKLVLKSNKNVVFTWCIHPNPTVNKVVVNELGNLEGVNLIPPQNYVSLLELMNNAYIIWTDSGGIQEEAPEFNKPVIILREETERQEIIDAGLGFLVGTDAQKIVSLTKKLIDDKIYYNSFKRIKNPFGDGLASERITSILLNQK